MDSKLFEASGTGNVDSIKTLLKQEGVDVNWQHPESGLTSLHNACMLGHAEAVSTLIEDVRVDVNKADNTDSSALHHACAANLLEVVNALLAAQNVDTEKINKEKKKAVELTTHREIQSVINDYVSRRSQGFRRLGGVLAEFGFGRMEQSCENCKRLEKKLDDMESVHQKKVEKLEDEVTGLKNEFQTERQGFQSEFKKMNDKISKLQEDFEGFKKKEKKKHQKLLMGSVVFNFLDCTVIHVFGKGHKESYPGLEDIKNKAVSRGDWKTNWESFEKFFLTDNNYTLNDVDIWIQTVKKNRLREAHPVTDFGLKVKPQPAELQSISNDVFQTKGKSERAMQLQIIDTLGRMAGQMNRDILE